MIPFSELTELAGKLIVQLNHYVSIGIEYSGYPGTESTLYYKYYDAKIRKTAGFNTAQELKAYMENILNPPVDAGVEVE